MSEPNDNSINMGAISLEDDDAITTTATEGGIYEDEFDENEPAFIDPYASDVVEVTVDANGIAADDDDELMGIEEDDDDEDETQSKLSDAMEDDGPPDLSMSAHRHRHTDSAYAVDLDFSSSPSGEGAVLRVVSGGGDDKCRWSVWRRNGDNNFSPLPEEEGESKVLSEHTDSVSCVAFNTSTSPTEKMLAVGAYDGSLRLYKVPDGEDNGSNDASSPFVLLHTLEGPSDCEWIAWHPKGGTVLLTGSSDGTAWMYHASTGKCLQVFCGHEGEVDCGGFTAEGKAVLTGGADGTLRVWAPRTGASRHVYSFSNHGGVHCLDVLASSSDGGGGDSSSSKSSMILAGCDDGSVHLCVCGSQKKAVLSVLRHTSESTSPTSMSLPSPGNDDDTVETMAPPTSVEAVAFFNNRSNDHDYRWCATGGLDGVVKVWDLGAADGRCRRTLLTPTTNTTRAGKGVGITRLRWHPRLPHVFASTADGCVHRWDARTGELLTTLTGGHRTAVNDLAMVDTGDMNVMVMATASDDGVVKLFLTDNDGR